VLRSETGTRPVRTRKIGGFVYEMLAVEAYIPDDARIASLRPIERLESDTVHRAIEAGEWRRHDYASTKGYPAHIRKASASNVKGWPELAAWRGAPHGRPYVVWIRADMAEFGTDEIIPEPVPETPAVEPDPSPAMGQMEFAI